MRASAAAVERVRAQYRVTQADGIPDLDASAAATRQRSEQVVRSLANLVKANWAEKMANGRYRLAEKPVQIGLSFSSALARAETDLAGIRGRYIKQF